MKRKWILVGILSSAIVVAMWDSGFLSRVYEWIIKVQANTVIAVFTIILAGTTIAYTVVTSALLKQTRKALVADILLRVTEPLRHELREKPGIEPKKWDMIRENIKDSVSTSAMESIMTSLNKVDMKLAKEVGLSLEGYVNTFNKSMEQRMKPIWKKVRELEKQMKASPPSDSAKS